MVESKPIWIFIFTVFIAGILSIPQFIPSSATNFKPLTELVFEKEKEQVIPNIFEEVTPATFCPKHFTEFKFECFISVINQLVHLQVQTQNRLILKISSLYHLPSKFHFSENSEPSDRIG